MKKLSFLLLLIAAPTFAADNDFSAVEEKLKNAISADIRSEKEVKRDSNRLPMETLKFFGLRDDMKVIELVPGGGWYTKLLAPVLAEKGEFSVAVGTGRVESKVLGQPGMEKIKILKAEASIRREEGSRFYTMDKLDLGVTNVDIVFTFRNYHNFNEEGRRRMNEAAFNALKPGGIYAVVDHTRRHMEGLNDENGRRVDPVLAIKEIQEAGFVLADYSDLHYRADDELRYEVGRKSVTGNTDRFTFKFKKVK